MSEFWNNKIKPGYYDLALKSGRLSDKSPQAAWHNKTFTKISNFINNEDYLLDYACGPGTFTGQYLDLKKNPLCVDISEKQINLLPFIIGNFLGGAVLILSMKLVINLPTSIKSFFQKT